MQKTQTKLAYLYTSVLERCTILYLEDVPYFLSCKLFFKKKNDLKYVTLSYGAAAKQLL